MLQLDHVVLPVWDAEKSLAFYRDVLELKLLETHDGEDWGGYPWLMILFALGDGRQIVLVHFLGAPRPPSDALPREGRHVAMAETESLDGWRTKLQRAGVEFWEEDHGAQQSLYFEDPNGVVLEITSPPSVPAPAENARALERAARWIQQRT